MTNHQGTQWETEIINDSLLPGDRLTKRSVDGEADLWLNKHPLGAKWTIPAVYWKRLVPKKGKQRRTPDGARDVVIMYRDDLEQLIGYVNDAWAPIPSLVIQAKWTERLNVTRTLHSLTKAIEQVYGGKTEED